jgi:lipase
MTHSKSDAPIVLVHGLVGHLDEERVIRRLAPRRVLAPDLLGYGRHAQVDPARVSISAQVDHLRAVLDQAGIGDAHFVGHSVGGVVAAAFARRQPRRIRSLVSAEGNFTLKDAFWSARVADQPLEQLQQWLEDQRSDPAGWLRDAGVTRTDERVKAALQHLHHQPASTIHATARSVIEFTARDSYEPLLRSVFAATPVSLLAGEHSRDGWDVPGWATEASRRFEVLPGVGHLMSLEDPEGFADAIERLTGNKVE